MAQAGVSANRLELLQIADAVAREKSIDRSIVLASMVIGTLIGLIGLIISDMVLAMVDPRIRFR